MNDITLPLATAVVIVIALLGAFAFLVRVTAGNFEKSVKEKFTQAEASRTADQTALLIVLRKRGLREQFDAVCASLPPEQQEYVKEMLQMPYTRRDHPLVEILRQAFGFTPEQTDELFAEADQV